MLALPCTVDPDLGSCSFHWATAEFKEVLGTALGPQSLVCEGEAGRGLG